MFHVKVDWECLIDEHSTSFCGQTLIHRLLADEQGYRILARFGEEEKEAFAGTNLLFAVTAYTAIVRGVVTPCTLTDVLSDLKTEKAST